MSSPTPWMQESVSTNARFMDTLSCIHGHTFLHSWTHFLAFMDSLSCIHGHTFLHSWTHFLAFMDTLSCIHGHTFLHSWTHFLAFMDSLSCIHGHTFLQSVSMNARKWVHECKKVCPWMQESVSMNARKCVHAQKPYPSLAFAHESSKVGESVTNNWL